MILEMKVPSPGESITEVEIAQWLVKDGDYVEKDQAVAEVDSDKATLELPAEVSGTIILKAEEGDAVNVGEVVCTIDTEGKPTKGIESKTEIKNLDVSEEVKVETKNYATGTPSPSAKKIISERNLDISSIKGSGRDGRITKSDAEKAKPSMGTAPTDGERKSESKKMSLLRRKVAERLVSAKNETAMLTTFNEADLSKIFKIRKEYKESFISKHDVSLGFMSFFTKAVVRALKIYPDVNSMIDGDHQIIYDYCDISVAVSGPKGLMVPVVRNADNMTFSQIESEIKRLAIAARDGKITVDDMTGGTFTISNGGVFGSMLSTPIINYPQSAILGLHNIVKRPVVVNDQIEVRPIMYAAVTYDHRIIDGSDAVRFLVHIKELIEDPARLLIGL